jgi:hypothetical protein
MIQTEGRLGVGQRALDVLAVVALPAATAFLAFLAGLAALKPLDGAWHSDGRFFVSFGVAFLGGALAQSSPLASLRWLIGSFAWRWLHTWHMHWCWLSSSWKSSKISDPAGNTEHCDVMAEVRFT